LVGIKHNDVLRAQLKEWSGALKDMQINNIKNESYQLISFYIVFQGVMFAVVAQASTLNYNNSYFPTFLSWLVSLVTSVGVYQKLNGFNNLKSILEDVIENAMVKISIFRQNDF
jgi:hypothetical protein